MEIKKEIKTEEYVVGVIIGRFQVHELHTAHKSLIDRVVNNHKKVILFLGISTIQNTKSNPLDYATRAGMIQKEYPNIIILPLKDQRTNEKWSNILDQKINEPFGESTFLLYGSRDSFIPSYMGRYKTTELTTDVYVSGSKVREEISKGILNSSDFRAGVIHANYASRPVTYPTVDIVAYNEDKTKILLGKKPNEVKYRFVGGFVDRGDISYEFAAKREFSEETGGNANIGDLEYVTSMKIDDWRYRNNENGIMTTLFMGKFLWGSINPSDDIEELKWVLLEDLNSIEKINELIMEEHIELMKILMNKLK